MSLYQCLSECRGQLSEKQTEAETTLEPRDIIYTVFIPSGGEGHSIRVTSTSSQQVAQEAQGAKEEQPFEELVPAPYHDYMSSLKRPLTSYVPPWKPWDHTINLTSGMELPCSHMIPLSPTEQKELDAFLWENVANGCIFPSKSPIGHWSSLSKRRMVCFTY